MYVYEFSRIWFDVLFVLMYSIKQELVNKKSCFLGKSHLILYSLGLRWRQTRLLRCQSPSSSCSFHFRLFFYFRLHSHPSWPSPSIAMRSCRGVAAESFAGAAGTASRAFIFGSGVLTRPLSSPSFAKSVITMRPVRSTFTLIYPKRGAVAQSCAQKREGIRFLYKLSTNFSKNTFIHSRRLPSVWSLFYHFATFGAMHMKTFSRASHSVIHFHRNCFSLWFLDRKSVV